MSRYYLQVLDQGATIADPVETAARDLEEARVMAIAGIRDILSHELLTGELDLRGQIDITDPNGVVLMVVPFWEAVQIHHV